MTFKPGESGNPNGRPKLTDEEKEVKDFIKERGVEIVQRLHDLLFNAKDERVAIQAAVALLDRGFGKPAQQMYSSGDGAKAVDSPRARIAEGLKDPKLRKRLRSVVFDINKKVEKKKKINLKAS